MMRPHSQQGFTLVEMVMVIVITGIIGGMVAVFIRTPVQQYMDVARRADMTDTADTALRRIGRDVRLALPNSVRVSGACGGAGTTCFIEFLPTKGGGRYRAGIETSGPPSAGCGSLALDVLDFSAADTCFEVLGAMPPGLVAGDRVVVYNQGTGTGADAYTANTTNDNTGAYLSNTAATITISPGKLFPLASPSSRFQVISTPVSYVCDGAGALWRYWGYAIQPAQPATIAILNGLAGVLSARIANNVGMCNFSYQANVVAERSGLVTMNLALTNSGETVTLYSATHVSNVP